MTQYRAAAPETLGIVPLDVLTLIYHRSSGMTHIVDSPVPEILEALAGGPLTTPELLARLGERFDLVDPDPQALGVRLDELLATGLVERL